MYNKYHPVIIARVSLQVPVISTVPGPTDCGDPAPTAFSIRLDVRVDVGLLRRHLVLRGRRRRRQLARLRGRVVVIGRSVVRFLFAAVRAVVTWTVVVLVGLGRDVGVAERDVAVVVGGGVVICRTVGLGLEGKYFFSSIVDGNE